MSKNKLVIISVVVFSFAVFYLNKVNSAPCPPNRDQALAKILANLAKNPSLLNPALYNSIYSSSLTTSDTETTTVASTSSETATTVAASSSDDTATTVVSRTLDTPLIISDDNQTTDRTTVEEF